MITSHFDPHALQNYDYFSRPTAEIHPIFEPKPLIAAFLDPARQLIRFS